MRGVNNVDQLKLRYSFGTAGNNNIPPGQIFKDYTGSSAAWLSMGGTYYTTGEDLNNPNLTWETTYTHNIGVDFSFFQTRLSGSLEVYQNDIKNLLIHFPITGSGYKYQYQNVGDSRFFFNGGIGAVRNSEVHPTDNTVLMRNGSSATTASGGKFYSDMVFAGNSVWKSDDSKYYGDLIFLDEAHIESKTPVNYTGNVYFLGGTNKPGFKINSASNGDWANLWGSFKPGNIIFDGRTVVDDDEGDKISGVVSNSTCYFVGQETGEINGVAKKKDGTGYSVTNAGKTLPDDLNTKYNTAKAYDYSDTGNVFPTDIVDEVFRKMNPDGEVMVAGENTILSYDTFSADGTKTYYKNHQITQGEEYVVNPLTQYYPSYKKVDGNIPSSKIITLSRTALNSLDKDDGIDRIMVLFDVENITGSLRVRDKIVEKLEGEKDEN